MKLTVKAIGEIRNARRMAWCPSAITLEVTMTEGQMFDAMLEFAERIPSEAWHKFIDGFKEEA